MPCPMCGGMRSQWDCQCGYGHMHIHRHFLLRLIVALIVVGLVFGIGVKIGEFNATVMSYLGGYGYYHDRGYNYMMGGGYSYPAYNGGMMGGYYGSGYASPVNTPSSGSSVPAK